MTNSSSLESFWKLRVVGDFLRSYSMVPKLCMGFSVKKKRIRARAPIGASGNLVLFFLTVLIAT